MLEQAKLRTLPVVTRMADLAPAAQGCCGACRNCATTNIIGVAFAAVGTAGLYFARAARRLART